MTSSMTTNEQTTVQPVVANDDVQIDKELLRKVFLRWNFTGQWGWNYERMQGSGYCWSMFPVLKKIYGNNEDDLQKSVRTHLQFFNSSNQTTNVVLGINCAIEPQLKANGLEAIASLKTGLMGPLAGVGDSIFGVVLPTVFGSIAAYQAIEGSPFGCILWIMYGVVQVIIRWLLFKAGYVQGQRVVDTISEHLKPITEVASVVGLTVVGALVTSTVSITMPAVITVGEVEQSVQGMLDSILPGMLPLAAVAAVYALLSKKGMTSNKVIFLVMAVGLVLGCTGLMTK